MALLSAMLGALVGCLAAAAHGRFVGPFVLLVSSLPSCATVQTPVVAAQSASAVGDPLPSWNDTPTKARIIDFVRAVTDPGNPGYFEPEERIAAFDNDGTLWVEQPLYPELAFAIHRIEILASAHPEWKSVDLLRALLTSDTQSMLALGNRVPIEVIVASHTGMSTTVFDTIVREWIRNARHPRFARPYTDLTYQPQLELLTFLRANGFRTYIVCAGTVEFMRPWAKEAYGIRSDQVIGTSVETTYEVQGGKASLLRLPQIHLVGDASGKPIGIHKHIGQRPILAFGNSDGDFEMLQWTTQGSGGTRLGLVLHHDDGEREYAYDRQSNIGRLDKTLDLANESDWIIVSMKKDWRTVFSEDDTK